MAFMEGGEVPSISLEEIVMLLQMRRPLDISVIASRWSCPSFKVVLILLFLNQRLRLPVLNIVVI